MLISRKQFKKISVETQSGQLLGIISDFELETDSGIIEKYHVKSKIMLAGLWPQELVINRSQIINFDDEKMIVEDAVVKYRSSFKSGLAKVDKLESAEPIISSEES